MTLQANVCTLGNRIAEWERSNFHPDYFFSAQQIFSHALASEDISFSAAILDVKAPL